MSNLNDNKSDHWKAKIPRQHEQNNRNVTATYQATLVTPDIPVFLTAPHTGNFPAGIESNGGDRTCGQEHEPGNWNWKRWYHLERLCRKQILDDYTVRDINFEYLGWNLECEYHRFYMITGNC